MYSERSLFVTALVALLGTSCGDGLSGLAAAAVPLATLEVQVDVADARLRLPYQQLWVGLAWGAAWENPAICYVTDNPIVQQACSDPYLFRPALMETAVPLADDSDGHVRFELFTPPDTSVAIGGPNGRIAYGSVAVLAGATMYDQGAAPSLAPPYQLAAASFLSLHEPQRRVVFRQGAFDDASNFYPYVVDQCGEPTPGYSLLDVVAPLGDGSCAFQDVSDPIRPTPVPAEQAFNWACLPPNILTGGEDPHTVFQPMNDYDPVGTMEPDMFVCVGTEVLAIVAGASEGPKPPGCAIMSVWALKACVRNLLCETPEWDVTGSPPYWWPCN
jgi:hypothetical protein